MKTFSGSTFEDEVRNIARRLFSNELGQGAQTQDGRERDGIFWNGSFYTIIEATTEKKQEKAETDGKKTHDLVLKRRQEGHMAQGYVVTLHDPTADQRKVIKKYEKTTKIIGFDEFRSMLFDSTSYIRNRADAPFGSVFDHAFDNFHVPLTDFIEPTIADAESQQELSVDDLMVKIKLGERFVLTAEYGVGKSMLVRELFHRLAINFRERSSYRVPAVINLRDHLGQDDPVELLERHARRVGVSATQFVAAWNAGYVDLLLDGFDELSTRGWTGDVRKLREYRRSTHKVIRDLIRQTPAKSSVVIVGRDAYFDSPMEMREALGTNQNTFGHYSVLPFDDVQAQQFLGKRGIKSDLPAWMPTRPLLLSYLIAKNLLSIAVQAQHDGAFARGHAWLSLVDMIAQRESEQSEGIDKNSIKAFFGSLAVRARQVANSQRSFTPAEMERLFTELSGYTLVDEDKRLILRLPGLGIAADNASNRTFIDSDFMGACSALVEYDFVRSPFADSPDFDALGQLYEQNTEVGSEVLCALIELSSIGHGVLSSSIERAIDTDRVQLAHDIFYSSIQCVPMGGNFDFNGVSAREIDLHNEFYEIEGRISYRNSLIERVIVPPDAGLTVVFSDCMVGVIDGRTNEKDLPACFIECNVDQYSDNYSVNDAVLDASLPLGLRVLVVSLRKIYVQSGKARLESALLRGLDHRAKMMAPEVVALMRRHGFLVEGGRQGKVTYSGVRGKRAAALAIIQAPASSTSDIAKEARRL